jgi:hypothetical protein
VKVVLFRQQSIIGIDIRNFNTAKVAEQLGNVAIDYAADSFDQLDFGLLICAHKHDCDK